MADNKLSKDVRSKKPVKSQRSSSAVKTRKADPELDIDGRRRMEISGVCWIALGIFLFICVIAPSSAHWIGKAGAVIQRFIFACFGVMAYILPLCVVFLGVSCIIARTRELRVGKIVAWVAGILCILCILDMIWLKSFNSEKFGVFISKVYNYCRDSRLGGGVIASFFVYPIKRLVGNAGACVLFSAGLLVCALIATNFSIKKTGEEVSDKVRQKGGEIRERRRQVKANVVTEEREIPISGMEQKTPAAGGANGLLARSKKKAERKPEKPSDPNYNGNIYIGKVRSAQDGGENYDLEDDTGVVDAVEIEEEPKYDPFDAPYYAPPTKKQERTHSEPAPLDEKPIDEKPDDDMDDMSDMAMEASKPKKIPPKRKYQFPPISMLSKPQESSAPSTGAAEIRAKAKKLEEILASFDVDAKVINISQGPSVTRYELQPAAGVKISRIVNLTDDISMGMASMGIRIEAPIPGKAAIGIELPNDSKKFVTLREILDSDKFKNASSNLSFALGRDISGNIIVGDLAKMPHLLVAGATGMGKSVCIHSMLLSFIFKASPDKVKMILVDPKKVEFSMYKDIPHLLVPVVTDPKKAAGALNWAVTEMEHRYDLFSANGVNNMFRYNEVLAARFEEMIATAKLEGAEPPDPEDPDLKPLSQIVVVIDELSDLMMVASKEVEGSITRLAQMARAAGIHLVIATQRPSVDVITGVIKANIPSRIALTVSSQIDSRTIIDGAGAERLLGNGDMLYAPTGMLKPLRVQGAYVSDADRDKVLDFVRKKAGETQYDDSLIDKMEQAGAPKKEQDKPQNDDDGEEDNLLDEAVGIAIESEQASISLLQRKLRIGYARAGHLIDAMEALGVVSGFEGSKPRRVLVTREQWANMRNDK